MNWRPVFAKVKAALMRRGRTEHDADDLVQEAWVRLAQFERQQPVLQPEAFLMRAALNLSIDAYRLSQSRGTEVVLEDVVLVDATPSAEAVLLARERVNRLSVGIGRLPEKTRTLFLANRIDGKSYSEIAREHNLSVTAVERHIARATLRLASWMEGW